MAKIENADAGDALDADLIIGLLGATTLRAVSATVEGPSPKPRGSRALESFKKSAFAIRFFRVINGAMVPGRVGVSNAEITLAISRPCEPT